MEKRDFVGYGETPPDPKRPGGARIAVNFNLNYEGGGESTLANGDAVSEGMLNDIGVPTKAGVRVPLVESVFEFGSQVGVWRVLRALRAFKEFDVRVSVLGVVTALAQNPLAVAAFKALGHDIVSHGWRWIDYCGVPEDVERELIALAVDRVKRLAGEAPTGWMTGRPGPNTRRLLVEQGGFLYDRGSLADELPYWLRVSGRPHLVIPYSYETNDNRFNESSGFATADHFFVYMRDAFDVLYREGATSPKLLSIGLHDRLIGRPARIGGLIRFLEHIRKHDGVWICRGIDIARHWQATFPPGEA
ncbi:MAG TPA: chitin deacetylase [Pseudolabrys sp.]|jgi:peptidoglycan/xylan/chitin deacetylase (PgdA/CDA1 family)